MRSLISLATGLVFVALVTGCSAKATASKPLDLPTWAATFCKAVDDYRTETAAAVKDAGPVAGLTVEQRKARGLALDKVDLAAGDKVIAALNDLKAPKEAAPYQAAYLESYKSLTKAYRDGEPAFLAATSATEIEAGNARTNIVYAASQVAVATATAGTSPTVQAALKGITQCGGI